MNIIKLILAAIGLIFVGMALLWVLGFLSSIIWYLFWIGAIGAIAYELLSGRKPLDGRSYAQLVKSATKGVTRSLAEIAPQMARPSRLMRTCPRSVCSLRSDLVSPAPFPPAAGATLHGVNGDERIQSVAHCRGRSAVCRTALAVRRASSPFRRDVGLSDSLIGWAPVMWGREVSV